MADLFDLGDLIARQMDHLFEPLAPGVEGLIRDHPDEFELAGIRAVAGTEGSGAVGAYLDGLPTDRRVAVPFVVSERLQGMLHRRGFREVQRFTPAIGEWGAWWVRPPIRDSKEQT